MWSQSYDLQLNDVFAVQDEIAVSVAETLKVRFESASKRRPEYKPKSEAYQAYLQARYFMNRLNKEDLLKAKQYFQQAVQIDPNFSYAWSGLASVYINLVNSMNMPANEGYEKALRYSQKALELDQDSVNALSTLAYIKISYSHDWGGAENSLKRAMALEPENAVVLRTFAVVEARRGNVNEAVKMNQQSIQLDPVSISSYWNQGAYYYFAGRFKEAESAYKKVLELNPEREEVHARLGLLYLLQAKKEAAVAEMKKEPDERWRMFLLPLIHHSAGLDAKADRALDQLIQEQQNNMPSQIAQIYAYRGNADKAFEWLERAYDHNDADLFFIKPDQLLRNLHGDRRWRAFLKKMNLPA
jgi:tetratricopeptide (TPR) repeat protein